MHILVSNRKYFLAYAPDKVTRLHAYLKCATMFNYEVWRGDRFTPALGKYFTDDEIHRAKIKRNVVNRMLNAFN